MLLVKFMVSWTLTVSYSKQKGLEVVMYLYRVVFNICLLFDRIHYKEYFLEQIRFSVVKITWLMRKLFLNNRKFGYNDIISKEYIQRYTMSLDLLSMVLIKITSRKNAFISNFSNIHIKAFILL